MSDQSKSDDSSGLRWLRVHVKRTAEPGGVTSLSRTVYCPARAKRVPLDDCSGCGNRFAIDRRDRDAFLVCDVPEHAALLPTEVEPDPDHIGPSGQSVADVMTADVVCVRGDLSLRDLLRVFLERGVSGVPVVEKDGVEERPIGVVSKTDVVRILEGGGRSRTVEIAGRDGEAYEVHAGAMPSLDEACVRDVMTPTTLALPGETPIERAAAVMSYEGMHRLPVTSMSGAIVGLVSSIDIMRWLARRAGYIVPGKTEQQ
jgi:CBS domain-containing protein